jgi:pimeloyl-ACP methyl ester carboxylesterase
MLKTILLAGIATIMATAATPAATQGAASAKTKSIVLIHGAWADGSGWQKVYTRLVRDGYKVIVAQNPLTDYKTDVAYARRAIESAGGPVVLVGHSYGGAVITEAGNDPNVTALVYVAAFAPDKGESASSLQMRPVPGATPPPVMPPKDGLLLLDPAKFPAAFAGDVPKAEAEFMGMAQLPTALASLGGEPSDPAWRHKPSWYVLTTEDRMIPPETQRFMSKRMNAQVTEAAASHSVFASRPDLVASIIEKAAQGK